MQVSRRNDSVKGCIDAQIGFKTGVNRIISTIRGAAQSDWSVVMSGLLLSDDPSAKGRIVSYVVSGVNLTAIVVSDSLL